MNFGELVIPRELERDEVEDESDGFYLKSELSRTEPDPNLSEIFIEFRIRSELFWIEFDVPIDIGDLAMLQKMFQLIQLLIFLYLQFYRIW